MTDMTLVIGNRNYSSWSLRAGLALRMAGLDFEEIVIPLSQPDSKTRILEYSGAGQVPVLRHGDLVIWDSMAICEYAAEQAPDAGLWPREPAARAAARAVSAEMHSGFLALRAAMPMNIRAISRPIPVDSAVAADIARIGEIWRACRDRFGESGPYLFGLPTIADAMFAPVASRFRTYGVSLDKVERDYRTAVLALPAMQEWSELAIAESWVIEAEEKGGPAI